METKQSNHTPCPECGTPCTIQWSGLDLVENTGDETLASKLYVPVSAPSLLEEVKQLKEKLEAANQEIDYLRDSEIPNLKSHYEQEIDRLFNTLRSEVHRRKEEVERLKEESTLSNILNTAVIKQCQSLNRELLEGLKPLAKLADAVLSVNDFKENRTLYAFDRVKITYDDLRKAKELIKKSEQL